MDKQNHQEKIVNYWRDLVNSPDLVKTERNWSQVFRIKYEALIEVGFSPDQALKIVVGNMKSIVINNNIYINPENEE